MACDVPGRCGLLLGQAGLSRSLSAKQRQHLTAIGGSLPLSSQTKKAAYLLAWAQRAAARVGTYTRERPFHGCVASWETAGTCR